MTESKESLLQHYQTTRQDIVDAIRGLTASQMLEPSIDGWSVKDHLVHIALWDGIRADEVLRISAGHETAWRMTREQDEAFNLLGYEIRRQIPLAQAMWEFETTRRRLLESIHAATPEGLDATRYGEASLRSMHEAQHAVWIRRWRKEKGF